MNSNSEHVPINCRRFTRLVISKKFFRKLDDCIVVVEARQMIALAKKLKKGSSTQAKVGGYFTRIG